MYIHWLGDDFMLAKLQKWGNSQGVRIPKQLLALASFKEGDDLEITAESDKIIIQHPVAKLKKYTIQELFAGYLAGDKSAEEEWGVPSGKEEW
jgi:antitoxin MazE